MLNLEESNQSSSSWVKVVLAKTKYQMVSVVKQRDLAKKPVPVEKRGPLYGFTVIYSCGHKRSILS